MEAYLSAFLELPQLHATMRKTPGSCDWWRCHNYRYNFTFLTNAEAYLGFHLRQRGLRCRELISSEPSVHLALPSTRQRDWGDWRDWGPGKLPEQGRTTSSFASKGVTSTAASRR